jgi:serine/threonine protein kinase
MSVECVCLIAINLLNAVEELHKSSIVHRNLKPRKILFDSHVEDNRLYLVDYKYAKKFKHTKN